MKRIIAALVPGGFICSANAAFGDVGGGMIFIRV
jgi:hypothetical protein